MVYKTLGGLSAYTSNDKDKYLIRESVCGLLQDKIVDCISVVRLQPKDAQLYKTYRRN